MYPSRCKYIVSLVQIFLPYVLWITCTHLKLYRASIRPYFCKNQAGTFPYFYKKQTSNFPIFYKNQSSSICNTFCALDYLYSLEIIQSKHSSIFLQKPSRHFSIFLQKVNKQFSNFLQKPIIKHLSIYFVGPRIWAANGRRAERRKTLRYWG